MLNTGPAKKVTIYINEDTQHHKTALHDAIMAYLMQKGVSGATVTHASSGFGSHQVLHTTRIEVAAEHLPVRIEFVESPIKAEALLPTLYEMVTDGLIEVQDTTVVRVTQTLAQPELQTHHERTEGKAKLLRVFIGEADKWHEEPLHEAVVKKLRMLGIAGATVYRGIQGYGAKGHEHKKSFLHVSSDLPIMICVVDSPEKITVAANAIESMLEDGLIVTSEAEMVRLVRSLAPERVSSQSAEASGWGLP